MTDLTDFFPTLLIATGLLLAALCGAPLVRRLGLPGPAAFLAVGVVAGVAGVAPTGEISVLTLEQVAVVALYAILFQGGLETGFSRWRRSARPILLLSLPGTAATAGAVAVLGHLVLGFSWEVAALLGIALAPTDPAAVYAVLRGQHAALRARTILEGESGFNDPVGISLMVVAVGALGSDGASTAEAAVRLVEELGVGLAGGLVGAALLRLGIRATPHLEEGFRSVAVVAAALGIGAATASLHGSGFLAVYLAGLLVADAWALKDGRHHAVPRAFAAASEAALFALLAAAFAPQLAGRHLWQGVALALLLALAVRPLVAALLLAGSGLDQRERVLVSWGGLKGAVPLLLAGYPALDALEGATTVQGVVLIATAASIAVQGATLSPVADWARSGRRSGRTDRSPDARRAAQAQARPFSSRQGR